MSYILDALQRADAERARGGVPTLNARPIVSPLIRSGLNAQQRTGLAIAVACTLGGAAVAWWMWPAASAPQRVVVAVPTIPVAPAPQATLPAPIPANATPIAPATPPQAPVVLAPPVAPSTLTRLPAARTAAASVAAMPAASSAPPSPPKPKAAAVAPEPPAPAATPAPLMAELPEATRRQIPALAISGAVYSDNPAQRLLLVNGQVLNQGSQVAPDLTVVEIRANVSEFSFRGTRFRVTH